MRPPLKPRIRPILNRHSIQSLRRPYAATTTSPPKPEGDISSVFVSLSGNAAPPPLPRFAAIKDSLIRGHEDKLRASWERLLAQLREETGMIKERGSGLVPEMRFADLASGRGSEEFGTQLKKRGVAVVRGVVSEEEALGWKEEVREYVRANPQTRGRLSICDVFEKVAMCFGRRNNVFICLLPVDASFLSSNAMIFDSPLMLTSRPNTYPWVSASFRYTSALHPFPISQPPNHHTHHLQQVTGH